MKPIVRTMWMVTDEDGDRLLFDTEPIFMDDEQNKGWYDKDAYNDAESTCNYSIVIGRTKPPVYPENSLKKVIVTVEEAK